MKEIILLVTLVGLGLGQQISPKPIVAILRSNVDGPREDGSYNFDFETADGITRQEVGEVKSPDSYVVRGSYSYTAPDGTFVEVKYIADENGYRVESPLIPVGVGPLPFEKKPVKHRVFAAPIPAELAKG